jgi:hypothetical protein
MALNIEFVKRRWPVIAGSLFGLLVVYFLFKSIKGKTAGTAAAPDLSGGAGQVTALASAASLQNAQVNAQTEVAAYSASVQNNKTIAALAATRATVQAQEAVALGAQFTDLSKTRTLAGVDLAKTQVLSSADVTKTRIVGQTTTTIQNLKSNEAIQTTAIQGSTLASLAYTASQTKILTTQAIAQVQNAQTALQSHYLDVLASKGKLGGSSTGVSQIASTILSRGVTGPGVIAANQPSAVASSPGAILTGVSSVLTGLFG